MRLIPSERIPIWAVVVLGAAGAALPARAQTAPPAAKSSPEKTAADELQRETDAFVKGVQERPALDDAAKAFITKFALRKLRQAPEQRRILGADKFEATLDRIRDTLGGPKGADGPVREQIRGAAATWLGEQARSADPAVAVNAALLLGELRADGKPWIEGSKRLAALAAAADLKPAVRAAAVAGLYRQVDEATLKAPASPELTEAVTPALTAIVAGPAPGDDPAARWLVSRSLDAVAKVVTKASPDLAKALVALMADPGRSTDERVRAAMALGRTAAADSGIDAAAAVATVRQLAGEALTDSLATAKDRALAASLSNMPLTNMQQPGMPEGGMAAAAYPLDALEVERDAWRLLKLSEAVARPKLKKDKSGSKQPLWGEPLEGGLGRLLDDNAAALGLARQLREEAESLAANPTAARVVEAREEILAGALTAE